MITGAPGFPGTDNGGMFGLLPGGRGLAAGAEMGLGGVEATTDGTALGAGDAFRRFSASLLRKKRDHFNVKCEKDTFIKNYIHEPPLKLEAPYSTPFVQHIHYPASEHDQTISALSLSSF